MSSAALLAELVKLVEDERLRRVAERTVAALRELPPESLGELRDEPKRDELLQQFWDLWVEPEAPESLNQPIDDATEMTRTMAYQGVVIDHVMRLLAAGVPWRERAEQLVPVPGD
jgi:hypothetical protein